MKSVLFLDFDGVVNNPLWIKSEKGNDEWRVGYAYPNDGYVNNFQAIKWVEKLCKVCKMDIVVTSTWRKFCDYEEVLYNSGLDKSINVIDCTKIFYKNELPDGASVREEEILHWLSEHPEVERYIILDDEHISTEKTRTNLVITDEMYGFNENSFFEAVNIVKSMGL